MSKLRRIINNTIILLLGQAVTWISTLLLTIAYGRFLGDVKFGELYFALTFVQLIGFPIEFSFNQQLIRNVAQEPGKALHYLANILLIKAILWLALYSLMLLICWLLGYNNEVRILVAICGVTLLCGSVATALASAHYAFEGAMVPAVGKILEKGLAALLGIILLGFGANVQVMALLLLGSSLVSVMWQASWFFQLARTRFVIDLALVRQLIHTSIPFLIYGVLGVIYYRIDAVLLSLMTNDAVIGWYGAGYRIFDTLFFLPGLVIGAIMYPVFSKLSVSSESALRIAIEKSLNFLLFCSLPISMVMIAAAPNIVDFIYHRSEFVHTVPVLQALAPGLVFLYVNSVLIATIMSTKREKKMIIMAAIALVFNLGLNIVLIPRYQHVGAAIVTSLTELLLLCVAIIFIPRQLLPVGSLRVGLKALIASLIMALAIWSLHTLTIFVILPVGMLVYLGAATLLVTIPRKDLKALYTAVRQKAQRSSSELPVEATSSALIVKDELPNFDAQKIQGSFPEIDAPLPALPHSEMALQPEEMVAFFDDYAQTEPQLELPWWLRSYRSRR